MLLICGPVNEHQREQREDRKTAHRSREEKKVGLAVTTLGALASIATVVTLLFGDGLLRSEPVTSPSPSPSATQPDFSPTPTGVTTPVPIFEPTPTNGQTATPEPEARPVYENVKLEFQPAMGCSGDYYRYLDLDQPKFTRSRMDDDSDLRYYCVGDPDQDRGSIEVVGDGTLGEAPADDIDQVACERAANTSSATELLIPDMRVGGAWCMVTSRGQVAWIRLIKKGPPYTSVGINNHQVPTLTLKVTLWPAP